MRFKCLLSSKIFFAVFVLGGVAFLVTHAVAQHSASAKGNATGFPQDWTHHHVIFSDPGSYGDAMATGTLKEWNAITHDPRYLIQQRVRNTPSRDAAEIAEPAAIVQTARTRERRLHRDWSENMGAGAKVGAGQYPAKYSFSATSDSCSDFAVYNTGLAGSTSQASVIAYTNIYSGCSGNGAVPTVAWQYNTASGTISHSVVLSLDGSQVALIQTDASTGNGDLVILKWKSSPTLATLSSTAASSYRSCAAPCMTTFNLPNTVTYSSPYYDYTPGSDTLYVGDDGPSGGGGVLYKFTGVFSGTPTEAASLTVGNGSSEIGSPVYDSGSGKVFVVDKAGYLHSVASMSTIVTSTQLNFATSASFDSPIVDSTAGKVYVFVANDGGSGANGKGAVFQLPVTFTNSTTPVEAKVGTKSSSVPLYAGAFDNTYFTSSGTSPTGNLYVCGTPGGSPTLYQIPITANTMSTTATSKATPGNTSATCSPVTEFFNNGTDYLFLSVTTETTSPPTGCTSGSGCVFSYNDSTFAFVAAPEAGGTSGIVIDNNQGSGGSQIYFSTLSNQTCTTSGGTGGCAIQASQATP